LWFDDDPDQQSFAEETLGSISGIRSYIVGSSIDAKSILASEKIGGAMNENSFNATRQ